MDGAVGVDSMQGKEAPSGSLCLSKLRNPIIRVMRAMPIKRQLLPEKITKKQLHLAEVLVAEDNKINQMVIKAVLDKYGVTSTFVENGIETINAVANKRFDALLLDCQMPKMDGYQAAQHIRKSEEGTQRHLPIIAMTANAMDGDREKCLAGMDDYLT